MALQSTLMRIVRLLYPDGQAYRIPYGSRIEKLHKAIMSDNLGGFGRLNTDARQIMYDILPDNPNFTIENARAWYRRLGLYDSGSVTLADMKLAISQKMSWALTPLSRQNHVFIQEQLRAAGFDVYVYPNRFMPGPTTKTPSDILGVTVASATYDLISFDEAEFGASWSDYDVTLVANYIEEEKDALFDITDEGYKSTFYVAGATIDTFADVPEARKIEFRQLILKLKAAQMCAILFVNYT